MLYGFVSSLIPEVQKECVKGMSHPDIDFIFQQQQCNIDWMTGFFSSLKELSEIGGIISPSCGQIINETLV